ncbi:LacI family DNA-binding transcriptional regulator, partial [Streptomyces vinaceus]
MAGVTSPLRLTDIAAQAQVSEATVSRVLNGKAGVGGGGGRPRGRRRRARGRRRPRTARPRAAARVS